MAANNSLTIAFRVGAALTTLVCGKNLVEKIRFHDFGAAHPMTDQWILSEEYKNAQSNYRSEASGYDTLSNISAWWGRMQSFGPFNIKVLTTRLKNRLTQFINCVNDPIGWLTVGSFLAIHPQAYRAFTEPAKWLGQLGQAMGIGIRNLFYTPGINGNPGTWKNWVTTVRNALGSAAGGGNPAVLARRLGVIALPVLGFALLWKKMLHVDSGKESIANFAPLDPIGNVHDYLM